MAARAPLSATDTQLAQIEAALNRVVSEEADTARFYRADLAPARSFTP
jgi:hypothetical protein